MKNLILASLVTTVSLASFAAFAGEDKKVAAEPVAVTKAAEAPAPVATTPAPTKEVAKEEVKTVAGELKDGTKIEITGDKVEVLGKDGKKTAAPDGDHELKDGSKITTKGGMIVKK